MTTPNDLPSVGTEECDHGMPTDLYCDACTIDKLIAERDELASRVREMEVNACRYEWLRENNAYSIHDRLFADCPMHKFNDAMLDAAIDAAISAKKGTP